MSAILSKKEAPSFLAELLWFLLAKYNPRTKLKRKNSEEKMKKILFLEYPKCTTCQKARRWLEENQISFEARHIVENNPNADEIKAWQKLSDKPLKNFFNTSGLKYKALALKDKLPQMSDEEQIQLLASDGMLVKRPLIIGEDFVLIGFKPDQWQQKIG